MPIYQLVVAFIAGHDDDVHVSSSFVVAFESRDEADRAAVLISTDYLTMSMLVKVTKLYPFQ